MIKTKQKKFKTHNRENETQIRKICGGKFSAKHQSFVGLTSSSSEKSMPLYHKRKLRSQTLLC
jgi:glutathione peroxidase-family protein